MDFTDGLYWWTLLIDGQMFSRFVALKETDKLSN